MLVTWFILPLVATSALAASLDAYDGRKSWGDSFDPDFSGIDDYSHLGGRVIKGWKDETKAGKSWDGIGKSWDGAGKSWDGTGKSWDGIGKSWDGAGKSWDGTGKSWDGIGKSWDGAGKSWDGIGKSWDGNGKGWDGIGKSWDGNGKSWDGIGKSWDGIGKTNARGSSPSSGWGKSDVRVLPTYWGLGLPRNGYKTRSGYPDGGFGSRTSESDWRSGWVSGGDFDDSEDYRVDYGKNGNVGKTGQWGWSQSRY